MKSLTVFTPTYNRAFCLKQVYDSMMRQTNRDFLWLIIDDGSSDGTEALVASWIAENRVEIKYVYQQNQGMHGAHNTAYANISTELNVCIDSDDYMPDDAVAKILNLWTSNRTEKLAGIIGLDAFKDGRLVGTGIPADVHTATLSELYDKHNVKGDKKLVLRTDVVKQFPPYPVFENERLVPLGTLYKMIDQKYKFICSNDVYCIVEYLPDGSSKNILLQYRKSPSGFAYARLLQLKLSGTFKTKLKSLIHLISSAIFAKDLSLIFRYRNILLIILMLPFGLALNLYIRYKTRPTQ